MSQSFEYGRSALSLTSDHVMPEAECAAINGLGEAHLAAADLARAEVAFEHAASLALKGHLRWCEARAHEGLGHVALYRGELDEARRIFQHAVSVHLPDAVEADFPRAHLAGIASSEVRCLRCVGRQEPKAGPEQDRRSTSD